MKKKNIWNKFVSATNPRRGKKLRSRWAVNHHNRAVAIHRTFGGFVR